MIKTLKNSLLGQFPGIKTYCGQSEADAYIDKDMREILDRIDGSSIAVTSCVAKNKDEDITENKNFLQGLEKLAFSLQGQRYTGIIIANGTTNEQLQLIKKEYENIYTQLSPFAEMQVNFNENEAVNISKAFSTADTKGTSYSKNISETKGTSDTKNESVSEDSKLSKGLAAGAIGIQAVGMALAPLTGGISYLVGDAISDTMLLAGNLAKKTETHGTAHTVNESKTTSESFADNESRTSTETNTRGLTSGTSKGLQLTQKNKTIGDILERLDLQLKRIKEFESLGMWECAAYFLSDNQYSAEIAASTYKALMRGEDSGVETSAVNVWGNYAEKKVDSLKEYIKNFIHPTFAYQTDMGIVPVNACSFVSGNELAIHIGLPRKSVAGFPVIEYAEFGKDVLRYDGAVNSSGIKLGKIYDMGIKQKQDVFLKRISLTMHTFITGSTGSGKSNTVYRILDQLGIYDNIPFLVIESAKGEYKNIFGNKNDVMVFGTNPKISPLLRINPFSFPDTILVQEHLDHLVEIFNVCWPMYAAMPAVLKDAIETSYKESGWDLLTSECRFDPKMYPTFTDVENNIRTIIELSEYSDENKGNYKGALITRLKSLTNGINGMIFTADELPVENLFEKNVVVDLSRVGSIETKALIMGLLVMKLQEYRMTSGIMNSDLRHITVLEEAHNLLKRTSTEQSSESANLLGKSVEMLANAIAEMRTYGEGFIIADQAPGLLDMSVIRNTNTKIILRLPDESDRILVGKAANLNDNQIGELARLQCGVAAVYQNDWIQPVLCSVEKYECDKNAKYKGKGDEGYHKKIELQKELRNIASNNLQAEGIREKIESIDLDTFYRLDSDTITSLFPNHQSVFYDALSSANNKKDKLRELENYLVEHIVPSLSFFSKKYQRHILNCIVSENSRLDGNLRELIRYWNNHVERMG